MTIDQLNKLSDEEVRVRVAERMGAKWLKVNEYGRSYRYLSFHPVLFPDGDWDYANGDEPVAQMEYKGWSISDYTADLNAAFTLVEKLRGEGWSYVSVGPNNHANWFVDFAQHGTIHRAEHPTLARAICLAFLAVTEREEG